jgi:nucleoside-diphosphate-sugar epimerase
LIGRAFARNAGKERVVSERRILIVGATGLVGTAATEHFGRLSGWEVVTLSRRAPAVAGAFHISADLMDRAACMEAFRKAPPITDVLYTALFEEPNLEAGWRSTAQADVNLTMLRNVLDGVEARSKLQHLTMLQGGKAYGTHLGRVPVPAKERWPRLPHHIFYWGQEDLIRERAAQSGWNFSILRPQMILGEAQASPMNMIAAVGVFACVMRELGRPLTFPGGGIYVTACADSRLIARAAEFCATHANAAGETFNIVNGDAIVWRDLWPRIAAHFSMPAGDNAPMKLAEEMPRLAGKWDEIVRKYNLRKLTMGEVVGASWQMADLTLGYGRERAFDRLMSPIKIRQAGFPDCFDTEDAIIYWLTRMQRSGVLPTYS